MRVLWVTDEVPDHRRGGGSIRQFHLLKRLSERAEVDLLMMGQLPDAELRRSLGRIMEVERPRSLSHRSMWFRHRIGFLPGLLPAEVATVSPSCRALSYRLSGLLASENYDVVQVEHETLAPLGRLRRRTQHTAWTITLHNLLSMRLRQWADASAKPRVRFLLRRDALNADRLERWIMRTFDQVVTVSPVDATSLPGPVSVVPNGVDLEAFRASPLPAEPRLILTGSWNWPPNVDAARLAATELLPRVRERVPGASLTLVGREPTAEVTDLSSLPGIEAHFDVESVVPHLQSCRVALVPISVGSGTRLKALEAMAAGRPVVGTAIGLDGLDLDDGVQARFAETPDAMAKAVVELLADEELAMRIAEAGRRHVEARFGWDAVAEAQFEALTTVRRRR